MLSELVTAPLGQRPRPAAGMAVASAAASVDSVPAAAAATSDNTVLFVTFYLPPTRGTQEHKD